jgi:outer membrane protein OmpA-like peptidoglycan-associated protein
MGRGKVGRLGWVIAGVMVGLAWSSAAGAQGASPTVSQPTDLPKVNLQLFRPTPGPADYFNLYGTGLTPHLGYTAGLYINYADTPLTLPGETTASAEVVDYQLAGDLTASFGLWDVGEVGLVLPVTLVQQSDDLRPLVNPSYEESLQAAAVGDLRLSLKGELQNLLTGVGLAGVLVVYAPTGTALNGDGNFGFEGRGVAEFLLPWNLRVATNLGYRQRLDSRRVREAFIGNEILFGAGVAVPLWGEHLDLYGETHAAFAISGGPDGEDVHERATPAELLVGFRYALTDDWTINTGVGAGLTPGYGAPEGRIFIGLGNQWVTGGKWRWDYDFDGVLGDLDKCPRTAEDLDGYMDEDGCPDPDNDGDGIPDKRDKCSDAGGDPSLLGPDGCPDDDIDGDHIPNDRDKCPEEPEDFDRFEDQDGCRDIDNDNDGIPDSQDACPDTAELVNGIVDEDGCPEREDQKAVLTKNKIEILEPVYFDTNRASIQERSFPVLDEVAQILKDNPKVRKIRIEGHTDDVGNDKYNLRLSQQRAGSVVKYLLESGISQERLDSLGYGEEKPIVPNDSGPNRQRNRRVEFVITDQGGDNKVRSFGGDDEGLDGNPF